MTSADLAYFLPVKTQKSYELRCCRVRSSLVLSLVAPSKTSHSFRRLAGHNLQLSEAACGLYARARPADKQRRPRNTYMFPHSANGAVVARRVTDRQNPHAATAYGSKDIAI